MKDRRTKRDWRAALTAPEKKRLATVERELNAIETKLILLRAERNRIQNRATVRAGAPEPKSWLKTETRLSGAWRKK